jgi:exonuclease VII small subunit
MTTTADNGREGSGTEFTNRMAALERLRRELESGDLDPLEALERCREAEQHYRAVDAILTRVEREINEMHRASED